MISVVIPTFNRLRRLERVLQGLSQQTYRGPIEVIVVSDGSSDGTDAYLTSGDTPVPVVFLDQPNKGPAAARNLGVRRAGGKLVVFLDDDVVPLPALLDEHVRAHRALGAGAVVIGPMLSPPGFRMAPWVRYEQEMLAKQYRAMAAGEWEATPRQFYTGNASVERAALLAVGGFDEDLRRAEDVELAYRLRDRGAIFSFVPAAAGHHYAERPYTSWRENAYRYGRNDVVFARDKGQPWLLPFIQRELDNHHVLNRLLVDRFLNRRMERKAVSALCRGMATLSSVVGGHAVARAALSAIYNMNYYQGVVDELGEPRHLAAPGRA